MSPEELKLVENLDLPTYEALKKLLCPYCDAGLPTTLKGFWSGHKWVHSIPGAHVEFDCQAGRLRSRGQR